MTPVKFRRSANKLEELHKPPQLGSFQRNASIMGIDIPIDVSIWKGELNGTGWENSRQIYRLPTVGITTRRPMLSL